MTNEPVPIIKRVRADRTQWRRSPEHGFLLRQLSSPEFSGSIALIVIDKIDSPWTCNWSGERYCIADIGYSWLTHFPTDKRYVVHTVFDPEGQVVHWYVDICLQTGVVEDGVPYFDDLFLDIVLLPSGKSTLLDEDELCQALLKGAISESEYKQARADADEVMKAIQENAFPYLTLARGHYQNFKRLIEQSSYMYEPL